MKSTSLQAGLLKILLSRFPRRLWPIQGHWGGLSQLFEVELSGKYIRRL